MTATSTTPVSVTIKFEQLAHQTVDGITRFSGFVRGNQFKQVIDSLDLQANPRSAKTGRVTTAIIESIKTTPAEFPFKTKGVLLGAMQYEVLQRDRLRIVFADREKEGILDGGHNTMAIGLHILREAGVDEAKVRKARDWATFRRLWEVEEDAVRDLAKNTAGGTGDALWTDPLSFLVPVELIGPADPEDEAVVEAFQSSLLEICAARNNNAELIITAKSNKAGFYEVLKSLLPASIANRIEWKTGEGGDVKIGDLIAMTWVPLSLLNPMPTDGDAKPISAPIPQNLYRNKGECLTKFDELMRLDAVSREVDGKYLLENKQVRSALEIAAQMPKIFDLIEDLLPDAYNKADGRYGRIAAVKKMNPENRTKPRLSNFEGRQIRTASPDGFLYPVVYGVVELMEVDPDGCVVWATDPISFIRDNIDAIAEAYKAVVMALDFDPVKVGKAPLAYQVVRTAYATALREEVAANIAAGDAAL